MNKSKVDWNDQYNINIKKEDINIVRQDNKLSLRKNNLQQLLLKKRNITDKNHDIKIEENEIIKYLPLVLITDFDIYDEKLEIIYNFLNKDFSSLKQYNYSEINVIYFCLLKLEDISFDLNFSDISVKNLEYIKSITNSLINEISKTSDIKIIYSITLILLNLCSSKEENCLIERVINDISFLKKLNEIYDKKIRLINDNIIWLLKNLAISKENFEKIDNTINYKEILLDYYEYNANNINNKDINYQDLMVNCDLIIKPIDFDEKIYSEKLSFLYPTIIKIFQNISSLIINKSFKHKFYDVIELLGVIISNLKVIAIASTENSSYINLFFSESFIVSLCSLIKIIIPFVVKGEITFLFLKELIFIPGSFFTCATLEHFKIYKKEGFIYILEEIMNIENITKTLFNQIQFDISNYVAEYINNSIEVTLNSNILVQISNHLNNELNENNFIDYKTIEESYYCFFNCFSFGDRKSKKQIIQLYKNIVVYAIVDYCDSKDIFINELCFCVLMVNFLREYSTDGLNELEDLVKLIKQKCPFEKIEKVENNYNKKEELEYIQKFKNILI